MLYILYNPMAHQGNNDLNIVLKGETVDKPEIKKIDITALNVAEFVKELTEKDRLLIRGGDGTLHYFANQARGVEFPCRVFMIRSGTGNDFLNDIDLVVIMVKHNEIIENMDKLSGKVILDCHNICKLEGTYHI